MGPVKGLQDMDWLVGELARGGADAILVHKGIARVVDTRGRGLVIHVSAGTSMGPDPLRKVVVTGVEDAIRLGADGVSAHINVGSPTEGEQLQCLGELADECATAGMPLLAMMYPRGPKIQSEHDPTAVAHAARIGAELGADVVKTNYTGNMETFKDVVKGCPVPVVIAGGPKTGSIREFLQMVYDAAQVGGKGVSIGRNVFQHDSPRLMTRAIAKIIHTGAKVDDAVALLGEKA